MFRASAYKPDHYCGPHNTFNCELCFAACQTDERAQQDPIGNKLCFPTPLFTQAPLAIDSLEEIGGITIGGKTRHARVRHRAHPIQARLPARLERLMPLEVSRQDSPSILPENKPTIPVPSVPVRHFRGIFPSVVTPPVTPPPATASAAPIPSFGASQIPDASQGGSQSPVNLSQAGFSFMGSIGTSYPPRASLYAFPSDEGIAPAPPAAPRHGIPCPAPQGVMTPLNLAETPKTLEVMHVLDEFSFKG